MDKAAREQLARHVLAYAEGDRTEVGVYSENGALTRFTHGMLHQSVASQDLTVRIRAIVDQRSGVSQTNVLDDKSLHDAMQRAIALAKLAPKDPRQPALPGAARYGPIDGAYVPETAQATAHRRAVAAGEVLAVAESHELWAAGFVSTGENGFTVVNTDGANASFDGTDAAINVKMNGTDSSGYGEGFSPDVGAIDAAEVARTSALKAMSSREPRAVEPGEWTVILEPAAFAELVSYLGEHFSAQSVDEGSSFLSDGLGRTYTGETITIRDDFANSFAPGMPFDYEGAPTARLPLIEHGVGKAFVTDSYWAAKLGRANTGHALPAPNAHGPQARNLVVDSGSKSSDQLIAETKRGLLITRFWYIRTVDQKQTIVTGMTRDGTFLIESGKVKHGVHNMRFNQSILDALRDCELSNVQVRSASYAHSVVAPTAKLARFRFTSGTTF